MLLERNVSYTLIALLVLCVAGYFIKSCTFGAPPSERMAYRITTEYFGASAEEVERVITIPLENSLGDLPGLGRIQSVSEFGKSRITLIAGTALPPDMLFGDIRECVERTRTRFPRAVQKPRIISSDSSNNPVYIVSFRPGLLGLSEFGEYADRILKQRYQRVPGAGEIETGGRGIRETVITLDDSKAAHHDIDTQVLPERLNRTLVRLPVGETETGTMRTPLLFNGSFNDLDDFRELRIPVRDGSFVSLGEIADITHRYRKPDQTSRINGEKRITLYIYAGGDTNPLILCRNLDTITATLKEEGFAPEVVYSKGRELEQGIHKILCSMLASMAAIVLFIGLFIPGREICAIFVLSIPLSLYLGISILAAVSIPIDTGILAGLIIGSGLIIDNYLVVYNHLRTEWIPGLSPLATPLMAATATTIIAFFPLVMGTAADTDIASIAVAISVLLVVSLVLSFTFLKKPFLRFMPTNGKKPLVPLSRMARPFLSCAQQTMRTPGPACLIYAGIVLLSLCIPVFSDKDFSPEDAPGILFTHVEFPSGTTIDEIDTRLAPYISTLMQVPRVKTVESSAKRGNAQIRMTFDPDSLSAAELAGTIKPLVASSPKGQFFVGMDRNLDTYRSTLTITGPDHATLRKEVSRIGRIFQSLPRVTGVVYHFKEGSPALVFSPRLDRMSRYGLYPDKFAHILRWNLQQPVAIKWFINGREQDVRVSGSAQRNGLYDIGSIPVLSADNTSIRLGDVGELSVRKDPDKLYRDNRQNSISFSVVTARIGLKKIRALLQETLAATTLPNGYGMFIDPAIEESLNTYNRMLLVLCVAVFLIYSLLAIQFESFFRPLLIISVIPFCAFPPLLVLLAAGIPLTAPVIVGLTVLSGMSVNNYILILDAMDKEPEETPLPERIAAAIEKRFMPLFLSSGTSILASVPILFTSAPFASTPNTLAIIVSLGLLASFVGSFMFLPALLVATQR